MIVVMLGYALKKVFAFVKCKDVKSHEVGQPIKTIIKDTVSAYQQNLLLLFLFKNRDNGMADNSIGKTLEIDPILIEEKPGLELKEISVVVKKENKVRRIP